MQTTQGQGSSSLPDGPGAPPATPGTPPDQHETAITAAAYVLLFVVGVLQGLVGSFQYSRTLGSVPVAAVAFAVVMGVTCVLGAWGMRRPLGGLLPAIGWFLTSFYLAMGTSYGSVLITNTAAGEWFLYGGSACAAVGVIIGFVRLSGSRLSGSRLSGSRP